jgi:4-amino-4-deoxy-L-arabinose transferase-like glycosyltransferase
VTGSRAIAAIGAACVLPRLAALLVERGDILNEFTEKSDDFARTFVESGTYGFVADAPSAYTQPLYGFFLVPFYALDGRHWLVVGLAQIALALVTALLVHRIGLRVLSPTAALVAAIVTTLNPYLIWHDVHVNREIVDQVLAAAIVLLALRVAERPTPLAGGALGAVAGLAVLGNSRLLLLPLVLLPYLAWRVKPRSTLLLPGAALLVGMAVAIAPWAIRNRVEVGCFTITTDARALWKANNPLTDDVLEAGRWIDAVPPIPGAPPTPQEAAEAFVRNGTDPRVDECAQMSFYQDRVVDFWREHPGEKAELAARGAAMLWTPGVTRTEGNPGAGDWLDTIRLWPTGIWFTLLFVLALAGLRLAERRFLVLALALLAYQTVFALLFIGATRYRAPWDFLLALLAAPVIVELARRWRTRTAS